MVHFKNHYLNVTGWDLPRVRISSTFSVRNPDLTTGRSTAPLYYSGRNTEKVELMRIHLLLLLVCGLPLEF